MMLHALHDAVFRAVHIQDPCYETLVALILSARTKVRMLFLSHMTWERL